MQYRSFCISCSFVFREGITDSKASSSDYRINSVLFDLYAFVGLVVYGIKTAKLQFSLRFCVKTGARTLQSPACFYGSRCAPVMVGTGT